MTGQDKTVQEGVGFKHTVFCITQLVEVCYLWENHNTYRSKNTLSATLNQAAQRLLSIVNTLPSYHISPETDWK